MPLLVNGSISGVGPKVGTINKVTRNAKPTRARIGTSLPPNTGTIENSAAILNSGHITTPTSSVICATLIWIADTSCQSLLAELL